MESKLLEHIFDGSIKPRDVKLSDLESITQNFAEERIIGEGGFATVYKGILQNGEVAVKRIKNNHIIDERLFCREVNSLLNVSHPNIVRFLGFCSHTEHKAIEYQGGYIYAEDSERILCFEYINNGSLEKYNADELRGLPWDTRVFVIKGICEGLQYLHMEKHIIHMDLKPANILINTNMVAKINDFGLTWIEENTQTKSTARISSPGYTAPEYIDKGEISVKYDVYSLGVIIIELVTGSRNIPDSNKVLRRWRHRLRKSGEETPFIYQQIARLIEIGILCQEKDPLKRPYISDILRDINELESTDRQISYVNESTAEQIRPYLEDDMLDIEPLELHFPFKLNSQISSSIELTNKTNAFIAFSIQKMSPLPYFIQPKKDIVAPNSKYSVNITLQSLDKAPQARGCTGDFIVRSTKLNESLIYEDVTEDTFNRDEGKLVDEVNLTITYKAEVPQVDLSLGPLIISDKRNLQGLWESDVRPTEAESKEDDGIMESRNVKLLELIYDGIIKPRDVKLSALERITQNFSKQRIIGEGGFATVYKGVLQNREFAVKRIRNDKSIDENLFQREVFSLLNVTHKNIVRFIGFCSHTVHKVFEHEGQFIFAEHRERILCFEYINSGSLEKYITDELRGLPWDSRVLLIKGICEGLQYLHMKRKIIHRDLKPANILIDKNMVAKISDFGLSRMEANARTKSTTLVSSPGYTSPEYIDKGEMSVKYDVYSLGVIIIELVTGHRSIPDSNSVTRRWRHRLRKSGKETPFIHQHIAKLIEIGLLCQEKDPYKRPFISDIMHVMNELESTDWQISNADESTAGQISPYLEDDMLGIEPLELRFPFKTDNQISCSIELTNSTNAFIAFSIRTTSPLPYFIQPKKDTVAPRSKYSVIITLQSLDKAPQDREYIGDFILQSTKVNESLVGEDITEDTFIREEGKLGDEVNLTITYKAEVPQVDVSLGSLISSDMRNLRSPQESDVWPTEVEPKITSSTSVELIKFEPPVVSFPFSRSKRLLSSIKISNITDSHVGFNTDAEETNVALYIMEPPCGVLPPWSTQELVVTRVAKEEAPKMQDIQCNDKYFVWSCFVTEDVTSGDLTRYMPNTKRKELPIVFTETSSNELIKFDPPELCLPLLPGQRVLCSAKIVNITDQYIGFRICTKKSNSAMYYANPPEGILPPLSTKALLITIIAEEKELEESQCKDKLLLWNENMKANDVIDNMPETKCTALPIVLTKTSSSRSDDLIQFDPPELYFPCLPNKKVLTSIKIVNLTEYNVGFNTYSRPTNAAWYHTEPTRGILPPRSTQKLKVTREQKEDASKDDHFNDNYFVWKSIVSDDVKDSELSDYMADQESKEVPIVLDKDW